MNPRTPISMNRSARIRPRSLLAVNGVLLIVLSLGAFENLSAQVCGVRCRSALMSEVSGVCSSTADPRNRPDAPAGGLVCPDSSGSGFSVPQPSPESASEEDGYGGEVAGALIGSVVSFYGLGILFGGGSLLFLIPGALIGMGIGSKF